MVLYGVVPIDAVMGAGTLDIVVLDVASDKCLVDAPVYFEEEIVYSAVDDNGQIAVFERGYEVYYGVLVPPFFIGGIFAQLVFHVPVCGEGANVESSAGTSCGSEYIAVAYGIPHGTVAAHAESRDGSCATVGDCPVVRIDVSNDFVGDVVLELHVFMERAVPVPTVPQSVGANNDEVVLGSELGQFGFYFQPNGVIASLAVQKIHYGIAVGSIGVAFGKDNDVFEVSPHLAVYGYRVDMLCAERKNARKQDCW